MTQERQSINNLFGLTDLAFREAKLGRTEFEDSCYNRGYLIIYQPRKGKNSYVGSVSAEDIFDENDNRFYYE